MKNRPHVTDEQYAVLFTFRHALLRYLRWSQQQVSGAGLTEQQHLLLLAVRSRGTTGPPSIRDLASDLLIRPNSTVELINRAQCLGLLERRPDPSDLRVVRILLTASGNALLDEIAGAHLRELDRVADSLHLTPVWLAQLAADFMGDSSSPSA